MEIPLNPESEKFIAKEISSGRYRSAAELIQDALRLLREGGRLPPQPEAASPASPRRSPEGILADLPSNISAEEIAALRREMWANFPRGDVG
jgi:Arc/MetJ-type ribon-helix-helix transcriptional regulator